MTSESMGSRQEPSVSLEWVGPAAAKISQPNNYSLVVRNTCNIPVQQVLVRVRIPAGLSCGDTEPKAVAEGNVLVWELGALQARQEKVLQMKLLAEQKGDAAPQAWVTFTGSSVMHIKVREPKLALKVQGPDKILLGETAAFTLAVTNPGDGSADQVKIHAALTEGLECPRGSKIDFDIGNLAAGETRNVTVMCMTKLGGAEVRRDRRGRRRTARQRDRASQRDHAASGDAIDWTGLALPWPQGAVHAQGQQSRRCAGDQCDHQRRGAGRLQGSRRQRRRTPRFLVAYRFLVPRRNQAGRSA